PRHDASGISSRRSAHGLPGGASRAAVGGDRSLAPRDRRARRGHRALQAARAALLTRASRGCFRPQVRLEAPRARRVAIVKFAAKVGDREHEIVVTRQDGAYVVTLDGVRHVVDAHKLEADFYS